ncbi:hypothetical protein [Bradyrhizobium sp. AZCC 2289]|uniref:hypothetical protein n=1 Tax=Bradyrhizobium sp. AZCC 2289 TaxID=3117026 RepID=UPI002FF14119
MEKVDRSAIRHLPKPEEGLVRYQIRIDDPSRDRLSTFNDLWRGEDSHPADLCVNLDQGRYVRLIVLERADIAFRSRLDEFLVEFLSAKLVLREPLRLGLCVLAQPRREDGCESADGYTCECREGGDY